MALGDNPHGSPENGYMIVRYELLSSDQRNVRERTVGEVWASGKSQTSSANLCTDTEDGETVA